MSFSGEVKEELSKLTTIKEKENVIVELLGYFITNHMIVEKNKISFSTGNEYNINRFAKLLQNLSIDYTIEMSGNLYVVSCKRKELPEQIIIQKDKLTLSDEFFFSIREKQPSSKALLRGIFLGSGSIGDPNKSYHLELNFHEKKIAEKIKELLEKVNFSFSLFQKKTSYALYTKEGDEISKFLAFIGASHSVLKFEEVRVLRDMRNTINRKVNCETANLNKTISTGVKQIEDIKLIRRKRKFHDLPDSLKDLALLREKQPDTSLAELGKQLSPPIGKSGVNHRFHKIAQIAEELRK